MQPPDDLGPSTAEQMWVTEGPNSGGIAGWWLYRHHMFHFTNEPGGGSVDAGIPIATWLQIYGAMHPAIARELEARGATG